MSTNQKINDCYFYFYSTCKKGDNCVFRHCAAALGTEETCPDWQVGKCFNAECQFRHMESQKKRETIPCYWESQPGGCRKPHCVFKHAKATAAVNDGLNQNQLILPVLQNSADSLQDSSDFTQGSELDLVMTSSPKVEPLVVNCGESDSETCSSTVAETQSTLIERVKTPKKKRSDSHFTLGIKTLQQLKREKELNVSPEPPKKENLETDLRQRIKKRLNNNNNGSSNKQTDVDFGIKTLDEIRKEQKNSIEDIRDENETIYENKTTQKQQRRPLKRLPTEFYKSSQKNVSNDVKEASTPTSNDVSNLSDSLKRKNEVEQLAPFLRKKIKVKNDIEEENDVTSSVENEPEIEDELDILLSDNENFDDDSDVKEEDLLMQLDEMINS